MASAHSPRGRQESARQVEPGQAHSPRADEERARQDRAHQDGAHQERARQDGAHQERARQERARQERARQDRAHQDGAHQDRAHQERAHEDRPHQDRPHQERARQDRARQGADAIELAFFGEIGSLTRAEVEQQAGVGPETSERMWRALGFVDAGPDARVFTSADVAALQLTAEIERDELVTPGTEETLARALGQSMSRLAQAQVEATGDLLAQVPEVRDLASDDPQELVRLLTERAAHLIGPMEKLLVYAWRRHAVAASQRSVMSLLSEMDEIPRAVGFADLVGFTSLARDLPATELAAVVRRFEDMSYEAVLRRGGRVVKTLGDEVMFSADDAVAAADIALRLAEEFGGEDAVRSQSATGVVSDAADDSDAPAVPPVRVGLAWGPTLAHGGDVLGPVVNIASRCTSLARPGTVLVDRELAAALTEAGTQNYTLVRLRPQRVRGYDHLMPSVLRRHDAPDRSPQRGGKTV